MSCARLRRRLPHPCVELAAPAAQPQRLHEPVVLPLCACAHPFRPRLPHTYLQIGKVVAIIVMITILVSILSFCAASMPEYRARAALGEQGAPEAAFDAIESVCVIIFTIEYLARLLTVTAVPTAAEEACLVKHGSYSPPSHTGTTTCMSAAIAKAKRVTRKLLSFILSPLNVVDFVAIAPYYVNLVSPTGTGGSLAIIRVLRLARVLRVFKFGSRMEGLLLLGRTMQASADVLVFLLFFVLLGVVLFGSIMFFCESGEYDETTGKFMRPDLNGDLEPTPFQSIPHSFWWTIVTMTTVGYGDFYPTSDAGRAIGALVMVAGVLVLALPITVIGGNFTEEYQKVKSARAARKLADAARVAQGLPKLGSPTPNAAGDSSDGSVSSRAGGGGGGSSSPTPGFTSPSPTERLTSPTPLAGSGSGLGMSGGAGGSVADAASLMLRIPRAAGPGAGASASANNAGVPTASPVTLDLVLKALERQQAELAQMKELVQQMAVEQERHLRRQRMAAQIDSSASSASASAADSSSGAGAGADTVVVAATGRQVQSAWAPAAERGSQPGSVAAPLPPPPGAPSTP